MIVFIAGMQRSGSTFAFNVVRELLNARGHVYQEVSTDVVGAVSRAGNADHVILKSHDADPVCVALAHQDAFRTICTVRRVEDAVASWIETFGFSEEQSIETMRSWFGLFREIRNHSLVVHYELIDRHPWRAARKIAQYVCKDAGAVEAYRIAARFRKADVKQQMDQLAPTDAEVQDLGFSYYDTRTYFHRRHVSSLESRPAEQRLSHEQVARIRDALAPEIAEAELW